MSGRSRPDVAVCMPGKPTDELQPIMRAALQWFEPLAGGGITRVPYTDGGLSSAMAAAQAHINTYKAMPGGRRRTLSVLACNHLAINNRPLIEAAVEELCQTGAIVVLCKRTDTGWIRQLGKHPRVAVVGSHNNYDFEGH